MTIQGKKNLCWNIFYHNPILCYFAKHMFDSITRMRVNVKVATQRVRASLI